MARDLDKHDAMEVNDIFGALARDYLKEKKRKRRWGIFFKAVFAFLILLMIFQNDFTGMEGDAKHAAIIDIQGTIFEKTQASADNFSKALKRAYKARGIQAVVLRINSPGGSPVQADYMYKSIMDYRQRHPGIKVYAVCSDICASAAYYVASAANKIYADPSSLVGSIGVVYNGFGFVDAIKHLGVERRLMTAGKYKGFLDPFLPESEQEKTYIQTMLNIIHKEFENSVERGRGQRLKVDETTFSGLFWTGRQAKTMGLIDDFASANEVVKKVVKSRKVINYTVKRNVFDHFSRQLGGALANELLFKLGLSQPLLTSQTAMTQMAGP